MSGEDVAPSAPVVANNPKIQELQKLRASNLITEEEYQKAIENIGQ